LIKYSEDPSFNPGASSNSTFNNSFNGFKINSTKLNNIKAKYFNNIDINELANMSDELISIDKFSSYLNTAAIESLFSGITIDQILKNNLTTMLYYCFYLYLRE